MKTSRNYSRKDKKLLLLVVGVESREFVCSRVLINSRVALEKLMNVWKEKKGTNSSEGKYMLKIESRNLVAENFEPTKIDM